MNFRAILLSVLTVIGCAAFVASGNLGRDANPTGQITFVGKNAIATANGVFHRFMIVESNVTPNALSESHLTVEVDVASLDTDNKRRDDHLRTEDFFEVERWPTSTVRIHSPEQIEGAQYRAKFDVTIRDIKKTIDGKFEVVSESPFRVLGSLIINRMDFGVGTPKTWNPMTIQEEIPVTFEAMLPGFAP